MKQSQTQSGSVKLTITLGKIAEQEKVEVTNEILLKRLQGNDDALDKTNALARTFTSQTNRFRQDILHDKTLELIASKVKRKFVKLKESYTLIQIMENIYLYHVYEREGRQERSWDIYSRLLRDRIILSARQSTTSLPIRSSHNFFFTDGRPQEGYPYINSLAEVFRTAWPSTTLNFIQCDIVTYCIGMTASIALFYWQPVLPAKDICNSQVMIHQPSGGAGGQTSDISIAAKEILRWRKTINEILSKREISQIEKIPIVIIT